jgi:hypothetical protein
LANKYSGRSSHDLAQYYVMPWVISNYDGKDDAIEIDKNFIDKESNLRNLEYPAGKLGK